MKQLKRTSKGIKRARKIKDLEVARELGINDELEKNTRYQDPEQSTPDARSDLPKGK